MPSWLKDFLGGLWDSGRAALQWIGHADAAWENWVDGMLHILWRDVMQAYILLTYDIANFSYYVGSFSKSVNVWVWWLRFRVIPEAINGLKRFTLHRIALERRWRIEADQDVSQYALKLVFIEALRRAEGDRNEHRDMLKAVAYLKSFLLHWIAFVAAALQKQISDEVAARKLEVAQLRQYLLQIIAALTQKVNAIIPSVNKSAAAGYNSVRPEQASIASRVIDDLATDNPIVKDLVGKLVGIALDLASVDDPVARLLASLLLKQVIDRLGVDKLAGDLAGQLGGALFGAGPPASLQEVTAQVAQRLNTGEQQWQQFYANGGNDLETLGSEMRESANPLFTAGMVAYFAGAVADPGGTAAATADVIVPAARAILTPVLAALESL